MGAYPGPDPRRERYRQRAFHLARAIGEDLHRHLGEEFVSLILMGSLARADYVPGFSDLNLFLVVKRPAATPRKLVTRAIEAQAHNFPEFYNRHGALVVIMLVSPGALTGTHRFRSRGMLDSLNRQEIRTTGVTILGEGLLPLMPIEEPRREDLEAILAKYAAQIGDYNAESYFGRMTLLKAILHVARMDVLLHGKDVVEKADIARAFEALHPEAMAVVREALQLRAHWEYHPGDTVMYLGLRSRARTWARALARETHP